MYRRLIDPVRKAVRRWTEGDVVHFSPGPPYFIAEAPTYAPARLVHHSVDDPPVRIGRYSSVSETATFLPGGEHPIDTVTSFFFYDSMGVGEPEFGGSRGPITVGNDVWIGREVLVASGVTIGDGAVVASRAVVTKDVAPYEIVGGVPAQHIRWRFTADIRAGLLATAWWDWPVDKVVAHYHQLRSRDIARFIALHTGVPGQSCEACDLGEFMPLPRYPAESRQAAAPQPHAAGFQPEPARSQPARSQPARSQPARPQPAERPLDQPRRPAAHAGSHRRT
jgi:chloramphenicol O-acetyltransferase type B